MAKQLITTKVRVFFAIFLILVLPFVLLLGVPIGFELYWYVVGLCHNECEGANTFPTKVRCVASVTYDNCKPYFRSLPTDEEMIENFYRNRADFERLAYIFQHGSLLTPEVKTIIDRINVALPVADYSFWSLPDPYSAEAWKRQEDMKFVSKLIRGEAEARQYSSFHLPYRHELVYKTWTTPYHIIENPALWKGYYYIPVVPTVEKRRFRVPCSDSKGCWSPLFETLNRYPLESMQPAYRQFERQWFIEIQVENN